MRDMISSSLMLTYIAGPLIGGVIGYITNDIAIRMLFRPHQAKYLFGRKLPFTPGIIPKEKGRIAGAVGGAISDNLMNQEVLEKNLLSEEMMGKLSATFDRFFETQRKSDESLRVFLKRFLSDEEIESISSDMQGQLTTLISKKMADSEVGGKIAHMAVDHVMQKMQHFGSHIGDALSENGIGKGGGFGDMISRGFGRIFGNSSKKHASDFINSLAAPVEQALAKNINEMLRDNSAEMVGGMIQKERQRLLDCRMSELLEGKEEQIAQLKSSIISLYQYVITERLPRILHALDISKMIETRINEMEMEEAEPLIMDVMHKELKAIVWLGALLGAIMGSLNLLVGNILY